jgi:GTPase Era involved in 16S rRNA processing
LQFITIDDKTGKFEVTQQAMMFLESLPHNKKIAIVAIAGPYRTGKSFLANRLLNQSQGFEIGATTSACTKGIWLWNKPIQLRDDIQMLLIDTEGLQSTERSTNIDVRMIALTVLLSSMFIYN